MGPRKEEKKTNYNLYFMPTMNRGKYRWENGRYRLPGGVRFNYAVPGGYLEDRVGMWPEQKIKN